MRAADDDKSTWTDRGLRHPGGHGHRRHPGGQAILDPDRAPVPTAPGATAGSGPQGPEAAGATATAQSRAPAAPRLGSATAAAVVEAEGEAGVEASDLAGAAATLAVAVADTAGATGPAVMLAGTAGPAGTAAGEQAVRRLGATTAAGARGAASPVGSNGHRAEDAAAIDFDRGVRPSVHSSSTTNWVFRSRGQCDHLWFNFVILQVLADISVSGAGHCTIWMLTLE